MSHAGSSASSVKRHGASSNQQRPERQEMSNDISQHSLPPHHHHHHHHYDPEWEAKEELRLRELEETRARAAQMEKTMRWWSDCTANWREKWSKVRTERNKAREEARVLRAKLEAAAKECSVLKREKQNLECEIDRLKKGVVLQGSDKHKNGEDKSDSGFTCSQSGDWVVAERDVSPPEKPDSLSPPPTNIVGSKGYESSTNPVELNNIAQAASQDLEFLDRLLHHKVTADKDLNSVNSNPSSPDGKEKKGSRGSAWKNVELMCPVQEMTEQKLAMLQLRLDEASKTILAERQEKNKLMKAMEKLQAELNHVRMKYEDIKKSRHDTLKELERLQAENAAEWGRRERLETEKVALERENKKLHTQLEDLEDRLDRKSKQITAATDSDVKALQMELHEKSKELSDLKHAHTKLKKVLQDKSTELAHALRRSEQYEAEVKKLRCRIEELKKELASAEDEVDCATNNIRKLQRTNDDLQEQVESLQVQVEHLQSRLMECSRPSPPVVKEHEPCDDKSPQCSQPDGGGSTE